MEPRGVTIRTFVNDFIKTQLDNYLHKHPETAVILQKKIQQAEHERKAMAGVKKLARKRAKKANLHNKKLRDCRVHYNDLKKENRADTTIFITEGDSASGSITKTRDVSTQAVFSLRGKPLNSFGLNKKVVYENEEFNLLQAALNIEEGIEGLRYNKIVLATDADVDGMHIRLLLITFFLKFFPELVKEGHVHILETPLFRVRNKKETFYSYSEKEKIEAIEKIGKNAEITRFKGLGDNSFPSSPPGDLIIVVNVKATDAWSREKDDLITFLPFTIFESSYSVFQKIIGSEGELSLTSQFKVFHCFLVA